MQIQINTDHTVKSSHEYKLETENFRDALEDSLEHFQKYISKVEVHFSDTNAEKIGFDDKRCLIEVRLRGLNPVVTSHQANNLALALDGATLKLKKSLDHIFGKMKNH
ncbi:MAG: HPF/RaiA family ribosome-associated protein [Bacteriovorax sp.]|nr:HPF/RaiA family ribosome-associated protein [Bacteriovorax sp.]